MLYIIFIILLSNIRKTANFYFAGSLLVYPDAPLPHSDAYDFTNDVAFGHSIDKNRNNGT